MASPARAAWRACGVFQPSSWANPVERSMISGDPLGARPPPMCSSAGGAIGEGGGRDGRFGVSSAVRRCHPIVTGSWLAGWLLLAYGTTALQCCTAVVYYSVQAISHPCQAEGGGGLSLRGALLLVRSIITTVVILVFFFLLLLGLG